MGQGREWIEVDLSRLGREEATGRAWSRASWDRGTGDAIGWIGSWGGPSLALARLAELDREGRDGPGPLLLAVGDAVRRGVPTAARASLLGRSPGTGFLVEGQVGGALGTELATLAEVVVLRGRTSDPGAVLFLDAEEGVRLESHPEFAGLSSRQTWEALGAPDDAAVLSVGPAGEASIPFATLGTGGRKTSFVGRGGLGALFGAMGLKALVVRGARDASAPNDERALGLQAALVRSPRLAARAAGGTIELFEAYAARGELGGDAEAARRIAEQARIARDSREGCPRCPTPCGWTFERGDGSAQGVRFGAGRALSVNLGIADFDAALELLGLCDSFGVDAKEVGTMLALLARSREAGHLGDGPVWGDGAAFARALRVCLADRSGGELGEAFRAGAAALARRLADEVPLVRGVPVRRGAHPAALLGQCVSTGGTDPMRSFPFLVGDRSREELERLAPELAPLPEGAQDPESPVGKGRLVAWHEDLVAGVDATGFCAFSMAGLLADGVVELDELAHRLLPEELLDPEDERWRALSPGRRLLAMGANLVLLRRLLDVGAASAGGQDPDRPRWAAAELDREGMLAEYRALRGLDGRGRPDPAALAELGGPDAGRRTGALRRAPSNPNPGPERARARVPHPDRSGAVRVRAAGALRELLGEGATLRLRAPSTVAEVLGLLADAHPDSAGALFAGGRPIPAVWRDGHHLTPEDLVHPGDVLDLVTAIAGG
ncbi:MAG TPA: hypothetical protein ENJ09_01850 [Planctomycetes bacterium]|nr:hypothetical protein [Planctomycetota bacterium]